MSNRLLYGPELRRRLRLRRQPPTAGLFARYSSSQPPVLTFRSSGNVTAGAGDTIAGMAFGPAASNRYLIACIGKSSATAPSAVTIGGVSATQLVTAVNAGQYSEIWIALVPTGTSGDVVVTAGAGGVMSVALYSVTGLVSAAAATATTTGYGGTHTLSVAIPPGGFALYTAWYIGSPPSTVTWGGDSITVDLNTRFGGGSDLHSAGNYQDTGAGITRAPTHSVSSGAGNASSAAVALR